MNEPGQHNDGAVLKELREQRRQQVERARRIIKEQSQDFKAIRTALRDGGMTVPEVAAATGIEPARVLVAIATLKKYGEVAEGTKDGSYFRYQLAAS